MNSSQVESSFGDEIFSDLSKNNKLPGKLSTLEYIPNIFVINQVYFNNYRNKLLLIITILINI